MKKFLLSLIVFLLLVSTAYADGPAISEKNYIQFTAADQETDVVFRIRAIVWVSFTSSVIVDTNILNLENGAGQTIFKMTATAVTESFSVSIPGDGIVVAGLKAEDLTNGYLYIFGERL